MSSAEAFSLLRQLLRTARRFPSYNVREYVKRRSKEGFRRNRGLGEEAQVRAALAEGRKQLEVARRQAAVYSLFAPSLKSIMELQLRPARPVTELTADS